MLCPIAYFCLMADSVKVKLIASPSTELFASKVVKPISAQLEFFLSQGSENEH
jgi:hypothetical protein